MSKEETKKETKQEKHSDERFALGDVYEKMMYVAKPAGPEPETPRPDKKKDR